MGDAIDPVEEYMAERQERIDKRLRRIAEWQVWPHHIAAMLQRHVVGQDEAIPLPDGLSFEQGAWRQVGALHVLPATDTPDFAATLRDQGARVQRMLWASTSTKNPAYRDVIYVEELIGPQTVNTLPQSTLDAFRDHGVVASTLTSDPEEAEATLKALAALGIDMDAVTTQLEVEGVEAFAKSFDALVAAVAEKLRGH